MNMLLTSFWAHWKERREPIYRLLDEINNAELAYSPAARFSALGKQLRHIADVQEIYQIALVEGVIDFKRKRKDIAEESDRVRLRNRFLELDDFLQLWLQTFSEDPINYTIRWGDEYIPLLDHLAGLLEHEAWHQGALAVYQACGGFGFYSHKRNTA